jgi:hypothetical protein
MEKYFQSRSKDYYQGVKLNDAHPENSFQVNLIKIRMVLLLNLKKKQENIVRHSKAIQV